MAVDNFLIVLSGIFRYKRLSFPLQNLLQKINFAGPTLDHVLPVWGEALLGIWWATQDLNLEPTD